MYKSPLLRKILQNAILLLPSVISLPAIAAPLYWDANGSFGGTGTWSTSDVTWNTALDGSGTLQAWNNAALDSANFRNTGDVTVSGTVIASSMNFGVGPSTNSTYTITGGVIDLRQASFGNAITNRGTNSVSSDLYLFGAVASGTENNRQRIISNSGSFSLSNVVNNAGFSGTGNQSLSLESYGGPLNINGNITKAGTAKTLELLIGGAGTSNTASYALGGNNTGLSGVATLSRGNLVLNHNSALPTPATALVVANATAGTADTAAVLIGTSGVSISKAITFSTLGTDTTDVRTIGSNITSGTATFSGTITLQSFAASGTGSSLRVTAAAGGTTVFSGNITDSTNSVAITKVGNGTVNFSRAAGMNYDGGTTVNAGTLLVNNTSGSGTGTGPVTVDATGTLGGAGIISGATVIRGTHSPGNSPGIQTFGSNLSYETSAAVLFELAANTSIQGTPTRLFDQIVVGGNLAFTNTTSLTLDFDVSGSTVDWSNSFWSANQSWLVYDVTGTTTNFSNFQLSIANWTDANGGLFDTLRPGSSFSLSQSGGDIYLDYVTVPEPSAVVIFTAGLVSLALRRRRS